jgi:hypothetical protein
MALGSAQPMQELSTRRISWWVRAAGAYGRLTTLTTFMCRLSRNLGTSNSWNPQGLYRPKQGLLALFLYRRTSRRVRSERWKLHAKEFEIAFAKELQNVLNSGNVCYHSCRNIVIVFIVMLYKT